MISVFDEFNFRWFPEVNLSIMSACSTTEHFEVAIVLPSLYVRAKCATLLVNYHLYTYAQNAQRCWLLHCFVI